MSNYKKETLTGVKAEDFFMECMAKGGVVPCLEVKQHRTKAQQCSSWMLSMTTAEERLILLPPPKPTQPDQPQQKPDDGQRRIICKNIARLITQRLMEAYKAAQLDVPRDFLKENYSLPATGISSHAAGALKLKVACIRGGLLPSTYGAASLAITT